MYEGFYNRLYTFLLILISFNYYQETVGDSGLPRDSNTVVGKPQLDLTVGIGVGLFVLFLGMAIYIYKPRKRTVRGQYTAVDQPMPV
ncbi:hypothetical protein ACROYT_G009498 [Oculina patagonica]